MSDYMAMYNAKMGTVDDALSIIRDGDVIGVAGPTNQPSTFLTYVHKLKDLGRKNVTLFHPAGKVRGVFQYYTDPSMKGVLRDCPTVFSKEMSEVLPYGIVSLVPYNQCRSDKAYKVDVFVTTCSRPDADGNVRMSLGCLGEGPVLPSASRIICEVNDEFPMVCGDAIKIPIERVTCFFKTENKMIIYPETDVTDVEKKIGEYVASLIEDGSTIQLGVGGVPNAASKALVTKNDLGIHTEMITTNMMRLAQMGVVNGKKKTLHPEKIVGSLIMGTQELYDFVDNNPTVELFNGEYSNDPKVIQQNYRMVSVNTCLQVDVTGQICSESFGSVQFAGCGGALDFAEGAHYAKEGKSIMALRSTAKNETISTIQAILTPGAIVTVPRTMIDYIVTEYGIADMTCRSVQERAEQLINIAHPKFRDQIRQEVIDRKIAAW